MSKGENPLVHRIPVKDKNGRVECTPYTGHGFYETSSLNRYAPTY